MINILSGDRPTGKLHIGHYVGSLRERVRIQNEGKYDNFFILIADVQALTDNYGNPQKVRDNLLEVMLDYLSVGLDPNKITFFIQSKVPALTELFTYFMNLVRLPRLMRNPTVKSETNERGYNSTGLPVGFVNYPISQAADILGFKANFVPVGEDQLPMLEQAREIAKSFNTVYADVFPIPEPILPKNKVCARLPGIEGVDAKMSKSLNNCIYLSDDSKTLKEKINKMYTDPLHININDPGHVEGNVVFVYLDAFCEKQHLEKYLPQYKSLDEIKEHYKRGGLGDSVLKKLLFNVLDEILSVFRERRQYYENHQELVEQYLIEGTKRANAFINKTLAEAKHAMGIDYFDGKI